MKNVLAHASRQRGATLVIGMIMLVMITLFVLAAVNMSTVNLRVMGNTQARNESIAAAQQAIEQVATTDFPKNPVAVTVNVDVNGDTTTDYIVTVDKPVCTRTVPIKMPVPGAVYNELNAASTDDQICMGSIAAPNAGISGATGLGSGGNSICSNTQWDVRASVADQTGSNATVAVHQGISRRVVVGQVTC